MMKRTEQNNDSNSNKNNNNNNSNKYLKQSLYSIGNRDFQAIAGKIEVFQNFYWYGF